MAAFLRADFTTQNCCQAQLGRKAKKYPQNMYYMKNMTVPETTSLVTYIKYVAAAVD